MDQVQRLDDEYVVLTIVRLAKQTIKTGDEAHGDIPFESILELEELAESRVEGKVGEGFFARVWRRRVVGLGVRAV